MFPWGLPVGRHCFPWVGFPDGYVVLETRRLLKFLGLSSQS